MVRLVWLAELDQNEWKLGFYVTLRCGFKSSTYPKHHKRGGDHGGALTQRGWPVTLLGEKSPQKPVFMLEELATTSPFINGIRDFKRNTDDLSQHFSALL